MRPKKSDRLAGIVFGSFVADSLALGTHWVYDQDELRRSFGRVTDLLSPREDSYHPRKHGGEQTHYGDQALTLMRSLEAMRRFDYVDFAQRWQRLWDGYADYFDQATKDTLANLKSGVPADHAASDSEELGGAVRIAPLLAFATGEAPETTIAAARLQTSLTHGSPIVIDTAEFLTRVVYAVLDDLEIQTAIEQAAEAKYSMLPVSEMLDRIEETQSLDVRAAAKSLGLACPVSQALPTTLALLLRYPDDLEISLIENAMAGWRFRSARTGARHDSRRPPRQSGHTRALDRRSAKCATDHRLSRKLSGTKTTVNTQRGQQQIGTDRAASQGLQNGGGRQCEQRPTQRLRVMFVSSRNEPAVIGSSRMMP